LLKADYFSRFALLFGADLHRPVAVVVCERRKNVQSQAFDLACFILEVLEAHLQVGVARRTHTFELLHVKTGAQTRRALAAVPVHDVLTSVASLLRFDPTQIFTALAICSKRVIRRSAHRFRLALTTICQGVKVEEFEL